MIEANFTGRRSASYSGRRPFTVGWIVIQPDGEFKTGFSMNWATAQTSIDKAFRVMPASPLIGMRPTAHLLDKLIAQKENEARAAGFESWRAQFSHQQRLFRKFRRTCKTQIVKVNHVSTY